MNLLITGASGFIGSAFTRYLIRHFPMDYKLRCLVRSSHQRHLARLMSFDDVRLAEADGQLELVHGDLLADISDLCEKIDAVIHFAAKTFVDHSIRDPAVFIETNVLGTFRLLEDARRNKVKRFIHVSTDEVYGSIAEGAYAEDARLNPTNPYSASKAGADALTISYAHAYHLHTTVTRTENNYGILQHPQKALPVFVRAALNKQPLPVYGDGQHVRQWLWVDDHVRGILHLLHADHPAGEVYHIAGNQEVTNLELAQRILELLGCKPDQIAFIPDHDVRPGHDRRYALHWEKIKRFGWQPEMRLESGLEAAVAWYRDNLWWLK